MINPKSGFLVALAGVLLVGASAAYTAVFSNQADDPPPALPAGALAEPVTLVSATPFTLDTPMVHVWSAEQRPYDAGFVLLLKVDDRALLYPRQLAEPVLYVGGLPVERVNTGYGSGYVVAILPAARNADGTQVVAGGAQPIFLGDPALPEQVDASAGDQQRAQALAAGVPLTELVPADAAPLPFPDHGELLAWCAATLVLAHAPDEQDLVTGLTVPRLSR